MRDFNHMWLEAGLARAVLYLLVSITPQEKDNDGTESRMSGLHVAQ
jgi:hypothetical protein